MLCNNFSSLLSTGRERIAVMLTVSQVPHLRLVDSAVSAPVQTAHRSFSSRTLLINHSTPSRPVARKMPIWCWSSQGKTGLINSMMICHNRPLFLETHFAFRLSSVRTPSVSHYIHVLLLASFHHGLRLRACFRNSVRCGIIATTYQSTTMALCGVK